MRNQEEITQEMCAVKSKCCCFTGHRPEKLTASEDEIKKWLDEKISEAVGDGYTTFITGMARGVDLWAGELILRRKGQGVPIHLICSLPYPGFGDHWAGTWRNLYDGILSGADSVVCVCETYSRFCFGRRNQWMVDRSSRLIGVYNGAPGGTKNTIDYAQKRGVIIIIKE